MKNILQISIFLLVSTVCNSQVDDTIRQNLLSNFETYKNSLVPTDTFKLGLINDLIKKWESKSNSENHLIRSLYKVSEGKVIYKLSFSQIDEAKRKLNKDSYILDHINKSDSIALVENLELFELIMHKLVEPHFPFETNSEKLIRHIQYYKLLPNQTILEIGAGSGCHSLVVGLTGLNLNIYINEVNPFLTEYLKARFRDPRLKEINCTFTPIVGSRRKCNSTEKADIVIMRNALHHFSRPINMLRSIRKSLKKDGEVYVFETLPGKTECKKIKSRNEVLQILHKSRLKIEEEISIDSSYLITCEK